MANEKKRSGGAGGAGGPPSGLAVLPADFLSRLTHEMKTHLAAAQTATYLLRRSRGEAAAGKEQQWLAAIEQSAAGLRGVLDQVDTLERALHEPLSDRLVVGPIAPWLDRLVERVRSVAPAWPASVKREVEVEGNWNLHEPFLPMALECIVANALKYSPPGGEVRIAVRREEDQLSFVVSDHGAGVQPEEEARLFSPFFQGANARGLPGCGLGLTIARAAVGRLGGTINYAHFPGCGSEFRLRVPGTRGT